MGSNDAGADRLAEPTASSPGWDRFAHWEAWPARLLLAVLATLLVLAALASLTVQKVAAPNGSETPSMASSAAVAATQREERFQDAPHPATVLMPSARHNRAMSIAYSAKMTGSL